MFKKNLTIHLADKVEVGFNQSGPNLAISGSLTTTQKTLFIDDIAIDLLSKERKSYQQFSWEQFRPHQFTVGSFQGIDLKMASKFFITPDAPFQYNILFSDQRRYQQIAPLLRSIKENWQLALSRSGGPAPNSQQLFRHFIQEKFIVELWNEIMGISFWRDGAYLLTFIVRLKSSDQVFELQRSFTLTEAHIAHLEKSSSQILAELCNQIKSQNTSITVDLV